ncbi:class I SAM-dependent methyltransferase [Fodinibius halophilus]|uniref:Class I SAM-dependent methyltransferase n=1 Tax=Fodinibius halophilus TaxID=1736908 RepID=A0A6M1T9J3_9BACT|nr:class I SAM-dependent methyltransferase [Fodinibius halophilus]NGP90135.1 class I SAM-dependent methyltransferase [Fodinibius halophilus]
MDTKGSKHTKSRYNIIAPLYNLMEWPVEQFWYKKWRKKLWADIDGPEVLEIGVGTGKNITHYPEDITITGIDLSSGMLSRAQKEVSPAVSSRITLQEMDAQKMTFPDNNFDNIVATFVFCSVPDPIIGLQEALRVCRPGGSLYLLEHTRSVSRILGPLMDFLDPLIHFLTGVHIARTTVENVKKAGWHITRVKELTSGGIFKRIEAVKPAL